VEHERLKQAIAGSLTLCNEGHHREALQLMDDVIAEAMADGEELWAFTLIRHAEILNTTAGQPRRSLLKHYYEQYLTYRPENPRALYGLADVAVEEGETEMAKQYASRCHQALLRTTDKVAKKDLFDLVLERWPELRIKA
jgi:Tfp pilus assembly protein PilF